MLHQYRSFEVYDHSNRIYHEFTLFRTANEYAAIEALTTGHKFTLYGVPADPTRTAVRLVTFHANRKMHG